jgi:hypothetical protein
LSYATDHLKTGFHQHWALHDTPDSNYIIYHYISSKRIFILPGTGLLPATAKETDAVFA